MALINEPDVRDASDGRGTAPIHSAERACQLLELFSADKPGLTLAEMVAELGWSRATTHRYAMTLRDTSFLRYDDGRGEYRVGPKAISLAAAATAGLPLVAIAEPFMSELARSTRVTTMLSVLGDEAPVVVSVFENSGNLVSVHVPVGTRLPLLNSAHGDILLAHERRVTSGLESWGDDRTWETRADRVRERGVAINVDLVTGICGVAAPILVQGHLLGVLGLLGTIAMLPNEPDSQQVRSLRDACGRIAAEAGAREMRRTTPSKRGRADIVHV